MADDPILQLNEVSAGYGGRSVVDRISLVAARGTVTALIGHNGSGKSTLLKAVFGLVPILSGEVLFDGQSLVDLSPACWLQRGAALGPQGNQVFNELSVEENITIGATAIKGRVAREKAVQAAFASFPDLYPLRHRRAERLSGGEKRLVALATAMATRPRLLILDEPSSGLSASHLAELFLLLKNICRRDGVTLLIVEQKVRKVLEIADFVLVIRRGNCVFSGRVDELRTDEVIRASYFSANH